MEWTIPGTVLTGPREDVEATIRQIEGMFLGGGMIRRTWSMRFLAPGTGSA